MISKQLKPSSITKKTFLYPSFFFCLFIFNFFLYFFRVSWYLCICVHMCMCVKNLNIIFTKMYKVDLSFDFCSFDFFDKDLSIFFSSILRSFFLFFFFFILGCQAMVFDSNEMIFYDGRYEIDLWLQAIAGNRYGWL